MSVIVKDGTESPEPVPSHAGWHSGTLPPTYPCNTPFSRTILLLLDGHLPQCGTSLMQSSVIFYLSSVPPDGACFTVVPRSHLKSAAERAAACERWPLAVDAMPDKLPISAPAGTAIVMNSNIWHASQPNSSSAERRTVHLYYHRPWVKPVGLQRAGLACEPALHPSNPAEACIRAVF